MYKYYVTSWAALTSLLAIMMVATYTPQDTFSYTPAQDQTAMAVFPIAPDALPAEETPLPTQSKSSNPAPNSEDNIPPVVPVKASPSDQDGAQVVRIQNPYTIQALPFDEVNSYARNTLVNIICTTPHTSFNPVSGSGVIVDARGTVLTNAHVAQYVLLQDASPLSLDCLVRGSSPARPIGVPHVLFISSEWIAAHAKDIITARPTGTGEDDVALLYFEPIVPVQAASVETREGVTFESDPVVVASYPAGFVRGILIQKDLYLSSAVTNIQKLYTFTTSTIDLYSLGGIILAQSGSSGGGVFNQWNKLVGIVVTSSEGATTKERDLRALSTSYIDRVVRSETGQGIVALLEKEPSDESRRFIENTAPALAQKLTQVILGL